MERISISIVRRGLAIATAFLDSRSRTAVRATVLGRVRLPNTGKSHIAGRSMTPAVQSAHRMRPCGSNSWGRWLRLVSTRRRCLQSPTRVFALTMLILWSWPGTSYAGYTSLGATVERVYTSSGVHIVDLDSTVAITAGFNCSSWSGTTTGVHRFYIYPITSDGAKAQLSEVLMAMATGKKILIATTRSGLKIR